MVTEALWGVVKAKTDASEAEMLKVIEDIDLRDGRLNGRTVTSPLNCAKCQRVVSSATGICPYCGAIVPGELKTDGSGIAEHDLSTALRSVPAQGRGWKAEKISVAVALPVGM